MCSFTVPRLADCSYKQLYLHWNYSFINGKVAKEYYKGVPLWFSGNHQPPSMGNSSENNLKKRASLKQWL